MFLMVRLGTPAALTELGKPQYAGTLLAIEEVDFIIRVMDSAAPGTKTCLILGIDRAERSFDSYRLLCCYGKCL